jgi:hypothetical protein
MSASTASIDEAKRQKPVRERLSRASSRAINHPAGWGDARSKEGRYLRRFAAELFGYLGHEPSPIEAALIRRTARLALRLELMDLRMLTGADVLDRADRDYSALNSQYLRCLAALGIRKPATRPSRPRLSDFLARRRADDQSD